jgi:2'-5' RNA ligase
MSKIRSFIAVPLSGEIAHATGKIVREIDKVATGIKWVEPENMHLTLKFLGDIDENETWEVCRAIAKAVGNMEAFDIECQGVGAFPSNEKPKTLWIGITQGKESLGQLQQAVDDAMADLGFRREPPRFSPHLTIGRVKQPGPQLREVTRILNENADFSAGVAMVDEVVLFSSDLTPEGPIYSPMGRAELL